MNDRTAAISARSLGSLAMRSASARACSSHAELDASIKARRIASDCDRPRSINLRSARCDWSSSLTEIALSGTTSNCIAFVIQSALSTWPGFRSGTWLFERIAGESARDHHHSVWETVDPDGRRVVLTFARWRHIVERHPELAHQRVRILGAVSAPDRQINGRRRDERWFYGRGIGPSRYVKVVVHYEGDHGRIATAFPRGAFP